MISRTLVGECPACGELHELVSGLGHNKKPTPGDYTICITCGCICEFGNNLEMLVMAEEKIPDNSIARKARRRIREMRGLPV